MMEALFGKAPSAKFDTQSTLNPFQGSIFAKLNELFGSGGAGGTSTLLDAAGGNRLAGASLAALEQQALGVPTGPTGQQTGVQNQSFDALSKALGFTAPAVTAPHIDATEAFRTGVVQPMTDDFLSRTLPAIAGAQGASAGGAYGSGSAGARRNAATDLERTLGQQGSQFALAASGANQQADLTASVANQTGGINAQKNILAALGLAPTVSTLPETTQGTNIGLSTATFDPYQKLLADMIAAATPQTVQTLGVGSGGSTGLLGGLLGGVGSALSGGGLSALIGLSDRRAKEDIEEVGSVDGFPLYRFRYKGTPERHVGLIAQDVEKRMPRAVGEVGGVKFIDYGAVIEGVLKEAA
jgi:hypothetical protein